MGTAKLEIVDYNTREMINASTKLIYNYAKYSGIEGTQMWPATIFIVADIIYNKRRQDHEWRTPGLTVRFSGFQPTLLIKRGEELAAHAKEPYFTLQEGVSQQLRPAQRAHIDRVTHAIVEEMQDVYKMEVEEDADLLYLKFPKEKYATNIEVINGVLL